MKTPSALVLYLAHLVEAERARGTTLAALAARWGVTHPALSHVQQYLRGGGQKMERGVAAAETNGSLDELHRRANAWYAKHSSWRPADYLARVGAAKNASFGWWTEEAERLVAARPKLAWAVAVAAEQPASLEPRADRRRAYVERAVDAIFDLPESEIAALENGYAKKRTSRR